MKSVQNRANPVRALEIPKKASESVIQESGFAAADAVSSRSFLVKSVLTLLIKKLILPRIRASKLPRTSAGQ